MVIKECVVCGKEFDAKRSAKTCSKECSKENKKQYYQDNKERLKQYYQDNKERILKNKKQYYQDNKERILKNKKQYYQDNKEHCKQYQKQYRQDNKERLKQYYQDNKERRKQYIQNNQGRILKSKYQYQKRKINELIKQYDGNLGKMLKNIPSRWLLREVQMRVWFNESYYDGIVAKIESTPCCEVTGEKDNLVVHHLWSFNTHPELGNDPTNMVRIHKDIHKEFHNKYRRGNNTPEQWEEFIKDYNKKITTLDDFGGFE